LYSVQLATGEVLMAHVPSHHDHKVGEWIGIKIQMDHVVTFPMTAQPEQSLRSVSDSLF
jgi:iron(III) transport system ATP-binding protein